MTDSAIVTSWRGLHVGSYDRDVTQRRALDVPRELLNMLVDTYGHLWVPPEGEVLYDLSAETGIEGPVRKIAAVRNPDGLLVEVGTDVWFIPRDTETPRMVAELSYTSPPMWVASMTDSDGQGDPVVSGKQGTVLFGNAGQTFALRFTSAWDDADATDVSNFATPDGSGGTFDSMVNGRHSFSFRGRRFVAESVGAGLRRVWYSELNSPLSFKRPDDVEPLNYFDVGGDDVGPDLGSYIGELRGFAALEDVLVILLSQSIWLLTGTGPEDFVLRRTQSQVGCISIETVVPVDQGLMFVGALPDGEPGVYLFTGSASTLVSQDISLFFQNWESVTDKYPDNVVEDEAEDTFSAMRWENQYVLAAPTVRVDRQIYVYDLANKRWSTFGGYTKPRLGNLYSIVVGDDDHVLHTTQEQMLRAPGEIARIILGWSDDQMPGGWVRFLATKIFGRTGVGATTITQSAKVPDGPEASEEEALTGSVYDAHVIPIAMRGHALELEIEVEAATSTDAVIESLELVHSRKREKVSRE